MPKFLKVDLAAKKGELFFFDFSRRDEKTEKSAFYVRRIQKESMAFAKGIRNGDRVVKLNNFLIQGSEETYSYEDLRQILYGTTVGNYYRCSLTVQKLDKGKS